MMNRLQDGAPREKFEKSTLAIVLLRHFKSIVEPGMGSLY